MSKGMKGKDHVGNKRKEKQDVVTVNEINF